MAEDSAAAVTTHVPSEVSSRDRTFVVRVVIALLAVDVAFIVADAAAGMTAGFPDSLHVYREGGVAEFFQYAKFLAGAAIMFLLARTTVALYAVWGGVFLYLFADDAFMLHERVAGHSVRLLPLDEWLGLPFEAWVIIEPAYMFGVGIFILFALWFVARRSSSGAARRFTVEALVLLVLLGAFSAVGDVLGHWIFGRAHFAEVIEDGGEMIIATLLLGRALYQVGVEGRSLPTGRLPG